MAKKDFMNLMKEKTVDVRPSLLSAEEHIKRQIVVLDALRDLIPPLTSDERALLEQNLITHGVKDPLTIWETTAAAAGTGHDDAPTYVLVDGHNRHQIIQKHHLDFRINLVRFASLAEVKNFMIDYQLGRRNLTAEQASYLRGLRYNQQKVLRGSNLRPTGPSVNVAETLATEYGVSSRTIKRDGEFAARLEQSDPAVRHAVLTGQLPKSAVQSQAQPGAAPTPNATYARMSGSEHSVVDKTAKQVSGLQNQIRKLANGDLNRKTCTALMQKTNDLLSVLDSK